MAAARDHGGTWGTDAFDYYGTWKLFDALMTCAFQGLLCDLAMGRDPGQRNMGAWSDGTPVLRMATLAEVD